MGGGYFEKLYLTLNVIYHTKLEFHITISQLGTNRFIRCAYKDSAKIRNLTLMAEHHETSRRSERAFSAKSILRVQISSLTYIRREFQSTCAGHTI